MTTFRYSAHNVDTTANQRSLRSVTITDTMTQPEALALIRQQAQELANERTITVIIREQTVKADRTIQSSKDFEMVRPFIADTDDEDEATEDDSDEATEEEDDMTPADTQIPTAVTMEYVSDDDMDFLEDARVAPATQTEEEKALDFLYANLDTDDFTPEIITEHIDAAGDVIATDEGKTTVSVGLTKADGAQTTVEMTPAEADRFAQSDHPNTVAGFAAFIDDENTEASNVVKTVYVIADNQTSPNYYGFGFRAIETRGDFFIVEGPAEHAEWMINRLASGMHAGHMQPCEELITAYMIIDDKMDIRAHRNHDGMATDSAEYQQIAAEVHASIAAGTADVTPLDDEDAALIARALARKSSKAAKKAKGGPRVINSSYAVNGVAGLAGETTTQITKALVREYYCPQAGIAYPDEMRPFLLRCETHHVDVFFTGYRIARDTMAHSDTWCDGCKAIIDTKDIAS